MASVQFLCICLVLQALSCLCSIKEHVSLLEYHCWKMGSKCLALNLICGDQGCGKSTLDTQSAGGFSHSPMGPDRVTKGPFYKNIFFLKDVRKSFPFAEDIVIGNDTITAYCEFGMGKKMSQVPCLEVLHKVKKVFARDAFDDEPLRLLYVSNDPLVRPLATQEMMGLFTNNIESTSTGSSDAEYARNTSIHAVEQSPNDTTIMVCKNANVQVSMFNSEDIFSVAGSRHVIFVLTRASQLEWLASSTDKIVQELKDMLEKHWRLCKKKCDIYVTDGPRQIANLDTNDARAELSKDDVRGQWEENRQKLRDFESPFEARMEEICTSDDVKQQIHAEVLVKTFCERKRYSHAQLSSDLEQKAVESALLSWPKIERVLKEQQKSLDDEITIKKQGLQAASRFSNEELVLKLKDNYVTNIKLMFTDTIDSDGICSHLDSPQSESCTEQVEQLLDANSKTLDEEHAEMECGVWPKAFTKDLRNLATNANESLSTIGKQMMRHTDSFELSVTAIEASSFSTPEELRKKMEKWAPIIGGMPQWLVGIFRLVSQEFKALMDKDGGSSYFLCVLSRFAERASDLASNVAIIALGFETGFAFDLQFRERFTDEMRKLIVQVFVAPVEDMLSSDLKKMTKLPNTCMVYQMETVGSLIKQTPKSHFASVSKILDESDQSGGSFSFLGKTFMSSLQTFLKEQFKGLTEFNFDVFREKWKRVWGGVEELDMVSRVRMLADKSQCQEDQLKDFPQRGSISTLQAEAALQVFGIYFTGFREDFNMQFIKFIRGHTEVTVKDENSKLKKEMSRVQMVAAFDTEVTKARLSKDIADLTRRSEELKELLDEVGSAKSQLKQKNAANKGKHEL